MEQITATGGWFPLHCHSHYSLLDGLSKPKQIAERVASLGYAGCAITDHGNLGCVPTFIKELKKKGLKPIPGCEFYICQQDATIKDATNAALSHLVVLAKGQNGWKNLIKACSASYRPEFSYRKPRLDLELLAKHSAGEFIVFSGHLGSDLANVCFKESKLAYKAQSYEEASKLLVHQDKKEVVNTVIKLIEKYKQLFGAENFFLEIQLIDRVNLPAAQLVANILRYCGKVTGTPCVATADSHYPTKDDAPDQRILLCTALETTLEEVHRKIEAGEDVSLGAFFKSSNYHIPSLEEMKELHTPDELENSLRIAAMCGDVVVENRPMLPQFDCPNGLSPEEYLKELCEDGWKKKLVSLPENKKSLYQQRLEKEQKVIGEANLSGYFLIVWDYCNYARRVLRCLVGKGRGSAAGCLVSFLLNITRVDPIRFDLLFERFYSSARNTKDRVALPDIDSDFPISQRDQVIEYVRNKYGHARVCQMATFARMQGRGALKDVLRVKKRCSFEEMNRITEFIPDEAEIADQLQDMREETGEASIIQWALENNAEQLKEWAFFNDDGELEGPYALDFAQAIRLEGTKRSMGKHASGVIISMVDLADIVPMVWDKSGNQPMVGVDMKDAESLGLVKFDILGTAVLDKIQGAESLIRTGRIGA